MPDIKWIKITTEMFDDEKIRIIERMPEADTLLVIWIRLICLAGKVNAGGHIFLSPELPYNDEQLAAVFNRELNTVRLAIDTFNRLKMIEMQEDGSIFLPAFEKHQNIEGMEKVRLNARNRQRKHRGTLKLTEGSHVTSRYSNAPEKNRKEEELFNKILKNIKKTISVTNYKTFLANSMLVELNDTQIVIGVKDEYLAKYLEENQRGLIEKAAAEETGKLPKLKVVLCE